MFWSWLQKFLSNSPKSAHIHHKYILLNFQRQIVATNLQNIVGWNFVCGARSHIHNFSASQRHVRVNIERIMLIRNRKTEYQQDSEKEKWEMRERPLRKFYIERA